MNNNNNSKEYTSIVYMLLNNGVPFYVGQSRKLLTDRLKGHIYDSKRANTSRSKAQIISSNPGLISIEEIETVTGDSSTILKIEEYWAYQLKSWGFKLVNGCFYPYSGKNAKKILFINDTTGLPRELKWFLKHANYLQDSTIERDAGLGAATLYKWKSGKVKRLSAENEKKLIEWIKKIRPL